MKITNRYQEKIHSVFQEWFDSGCGFECEVRYADEKVKKIAIHFGCMYDSPILGFAELKRMAEYFGTEKIDVDGFGEKGCDTCDYGSCYGHDLDIMEPTKNAPWM